eukprot:3466962-Rhodomonas_salina.1
MTLGQYRTCRSKRIGTRCRSVPSMTLGQYRRCRSRRIAAGTRAEIGLSTSEITLSNSSETGPSPGSSNRYVSTGHRIAGASVGLTSYEPAPGSGIRVSVPGIT